jgi:hypothetical protein
MTSALSRDIRASGTTDPVLRWSAAGARLRRQPGTPLGLVRAGLFCCVVEGRCGGIRRPSGPWP